MKLKKIIYIPQNKLTNRDYFRLGYDIFINKIIVSQALFSKNSFSTGVYLKGVEGKYFSERRIFSNIKPSSIKAFKNNEGILIGEKLKKKLTGLLK